MSPVPLFEAATVDDEDPARFPEGSLTGVGRSDPSTGARGLLKIFVFFGERSSFVGLGLATLPLLASAPWLAFALCSRGPDGFRAGIPDSDDAAE